eukprot:GEMP01003271.1.p1 GENE.GEMP01003271.1~~GEMP01003271.1.p1  ORF type:complete len:765 (-),score=137.83 GEMP01003271.1:1674-3968(-)
MSYRNKERAWSQSPPMSPQKTKLKQMKWMPKTPTGNPAHTYTRDTLLHWLTTYSKNATLKSNNDVNPSLAQSIFTVKMLPKDQPTSKSPRSERKKSTDKAYQHAWMYSDEDVGSGDVYSNAMESWATNNYYESSSWESPEMGPMTGGNLDDMWDLNYWCDHFDQGFWPVTSLVLLNVPIKYSPLELVANIKEQDFGADLNFLYLALDPKKENCNWGRCTVDFTSPERAQECYEYYNGRKCSEVMRKHTSMRSVKVFPARMQGIEWNLEELRHDPVLSKLDGESNWRPFLFENGKPMPFTVARRHMKRAGDPEAAVHPQRYPIESVNPEEHRTVMIRNIPNKYTRAMLHDRLKELFDPMDYNFIYMPIDFMNKCNVGYAFVNFRSKEGVQKALDALHNVECHKALPGFNSSKIVELTPARVQGLENNIDHLQNSEVLGYIRDHSEWTPLVFDENGEMTKFPILESSVFSKRREGSSKGGSRGGGKASRRQRSILTGHLWHGMTMTLSFIPKACTREKFLEALNNAMLKGEYDFVHMPFNSETRTHYGNAYINFRQHSSAKKFGAYFDGKMAKETLPDQTGEERLTVSTAHVQGLDQNIENARQTDTLEKLKANPDWIPLIFDANGDHLPFPLESTYALRAEAPAFVYQSSEMRPDAPPFNPSGIQIPESEEELVAQVSKYLEFYFSDENLPRDVFLRSHMDSEGFVPAEVLVRFPKLVQLHVTRTLLLEASKGSELLDVKNADGERGFIRIKDEARRQKWIQHKS